MEKLEKNLDAAARRFIDDGVTVQELVAIADRLAEADFPKSAATISLIAGYMAALQH